MVERNRRKSFRSNRSDFDPAVLASAAGIIRHFVEEYHEKLEQDYLFPRFRKAKKHVDLVETLLSQHQAGRRVSAQIERTCGSFGVER